MRQCVQISEQLPHTGRLHGPPVSREIPGHLFSANAGHSGPGSQHATRIEIVLMLRDDACDGLLRDEERAPDFGGLGLPLSDLEPLLPAGDRASLGR